MKKFNFVKEKTKKEDFLPNYAVAPSEILKEYLESFGITKEELSKKTGIAKKVINEILTGQTPIDTEIALKFEQVFSRPSKFWLDLESNYQSDKARIEKTRSFRKQIC